MLKEYFVRQGEIFAGRPDLSVNNDIFGGAYGLVFQNNDWYKSQRRYALHVLRDFGLGRPILEVFCKKFLKNLNFIILGRHY